MFDGPPDKWSFLDEQPEQGEGSDDPTDLYDEHMNGSHYRQGGVELIDVIEGMGIPVAFGWCRLSVIKYIWRAGKKADTLSDLKKARWYLDRMISYLEKR